MSRLPLIRMTQLEAVTDGLHRMGIPTGSLLSAVGLPTPGRGDAAAWIPEMPLWSLLERAARREGGESLGLELGLQERLERFPCMQELADALTLQQALVGFCAGASGHSSEADFQLEPWQGGLRFGSVGRRGVEVGAWQVELYCLGVMLELVRRTSGVLWCPPQVWVQGDDPSVLRQSPAFANSLIFPGEAVTALAIPWATLAARPQGLRAATETAEAVRLEALSQLDLAGRLRLAIRPYLAEGAPSLAQMAEISGMSYRTFQRRLISAGKSYRKLVEQARLDLVHDLLQDPERRLIDVALEAGYSDQAHFNRAFRRWTGLSPGEYRRQLVAA